MTGEIALVLGATGGIGGEVARRLAAVGWQVNALHRNPGGLAERGPLAWIAGDAMNADDVAAAARGARLIVHAVNPPGYRNWERLVLPMLDNTIAAARHEGARIILPGTVYNYGPDVLDDPAIGEDAPQNPVTRKGRIRVEMERRLEAAARAGDVRTLIVRCGDYFGPNARNNWFGQSLVKPGRVPSRILSPGRPGVGHQWAYLPDVADTMVRLIGTEALDDFARFHMEGVWDADGRQMAEAIRWVLDRPDLPIKRFPWWLARLASPAVPLFRELMEMRYLWERPVRMGNGRLVATLGAERRTPLDVAVRATLAGLGCLEETPDALGSAAA